MDSPLQLKQKPYIMAHRGSSVALGENTLDAFRQAVADGADIVETDLRISADGAFVCIHDPSVDRTTDGKGVVESMTLAELRKLNASGAASVVSIAQIPTIMELATVLPEDVVVALELKSPRFGETEACRKLADEVARAGIRRRTIVISFKRSRLRAFHSVAPDIPVGLVGHMGLFPPWNFQLVGPHWVMLLINPLYAMLAHRRGQFVCPLDPRPGRLLKWYVFLGCDAVLTDDPARTRERLEGFRGERWRGRGKMPSA